MLNLSKCDNCLQVLYLFSMCRKYIRTWESEIQKKELKDPKEYPPSPSPGELEGVPAAEAVGFLSTFVVLSPAAVVGRGLGRDGTLPMLSYTLETRGWTTLIYVLEGRFVDVVILCLDIRTAFLSAVNVICVGRYGLVRRWSRDKGTLGLSDG